LGYARSLLLDESNNLIITDLGLAKFIGEKTKTKTFKGAGTIPYMAPECWTFDENSIHMDIYSLGVIFFEILTGQLPFDGKTEQEWKDFHIYEPFPNITNFRQNVPIKLIQIITKMVNKRSKNRYQSVSEIKEALNQAIIHSREEETEIERLATIANNTIQIELEKRAILEKKTQALKEYQRNIYIHKVELFDKFQKNIELINSRFEDNLIKSQKTIKMTYHKLSISFKNRIITIELDENDLSHIREQYTINFLKGKNIICFGKLYSNHMNSTLTGVFGFNLLLVKKEGDLYGDWYIASFSDTTHPYKQNYYLPINEFLNEFPKSFIMHTKSVDYRELSDKDISSCFEEIFKT